MPDIEVLQDVPDELKSRTDTKGEASLRGHLKNDGDEKTGSQFFVLLVVLVVLALLFPDDLLHGIKSSSNAVPGAPAATDTATTDKASADKPAANDNKPAATDQPTSKRN